MWQSPDLRAIAVLCLLGLGQALLLALVLVTIRRGNRTANRLLAGLAVAISVGVSATLLSYSRYFLVYPHLSRINHPFDFLGAPLLFLYIRALISQQRLRRIDLLHFAPAIIIALLLIPFYLETREYKLAALPSFTWYYWRSILVITQFLVYLVLIARLVIGYSSYVKKQPTPYRNAVLFQIRFLVVSFSGLWVLGILRYAIDVRYPSHSNKTGLILALGATLIVYALAYLGVRNSEVLVGDKEPALEKKYERSTLTPERAKRYLERLHNAMEAEKVYTDGELTLQKLAGKLSIPAQHLSQVVNEQLNQNFLDFINARRVQEAKARLLDPDHKHLTILAIAEDVGFNSKSSFNAVFKKYTGVTPSEFRKNGVNGNSS